MTVQKNYTHSHDFKLHRVEVDGYDISAITAEFEIYQDLFSPYWTASVFVSDTQNIMMFGGIAMGSSVAITLEDRTGQQTFRFTVYQISDRTLIKQQHYGYWIHLISDGFERDQSQRINISMKESTASDLAAMALGKLGGIGSMSGTIDKYDFIVPNLSPMAAAQWAARWGAIKWKGQYIADLFVYQQDHSKWSWRSLEHMFSISLSDKIPRITQRPAHLKELRSWQSGETSDAELEEYEFSMEQYKFTNQMNAIPNTMLGGYGSTTLYHDIKNKKAGYASFTYGQDNGKDRQYKPFKGFSGLQKANIGYQPVYNGNMSPGNLTWGADHTKWRGSRKTNVIKLDSNRLLASMPGRIDIYDQLGKMTFVELPSQQDLDTTIDYDEYYKYEYVIIAMRHVFTQKSFTTIIELGKKRLAKELV